jgi:hypothetical protein
VFEKPFVIRPYGVPVVAVKALTIRNQGCEGMSCGIAGGTPIYGIIVSPVKTVIVIKNVAGRAARGAIQPWPPPPWRVDVATETTPSQEVVHEVGRFLGIHRRVGPGQGKKCPAEAIDGGTRLLLRTPEVSRLVNDPGHAAMKAVFESVNLPNVARCTKNPHMTGV